MTKTSRQLQADIDAVLKRRERLAELPSTAPVRYFARVKDVTNNRATVSKLLPSRNAAEAARKSVGRRLDLAVVERGTPMEVGERIWIGPQSRDTEIL